MKLERKYPPEQDQREQQRDEEWIDENRDLFWLAATVAHEEIGRCALLVNLVDEQLEHSHLVSYYAEGELEIEDEDLKQKLEDYDPGREFIVVLMNTNGHAIYCGHKPDIGWMADLRIKTRYGPFKTAATQ